MSQALGLTTVAVQQEKDQQGLREVEVNTRVWLMWPLLKLSLTQVIWFLPVTSFNLR